VDRASALKFASSPSTELRKRGISKLKTKALLHSIKRCHCAPRNKRGRRVGGFAIFYDRVDQIPGGWEESKKKTDEQMISNRSNLPRIPKRESMKKIEEISQNQIRKREQQHE